MKKLTKLLTAFLFLMMGTQCMWAYTFGIGRNIETAATSETANILAAGQEVVKGEYPSGVTVTQTTTCDYANANATLYHGATDKANEYTAANAWRNMLNREAVNGAFNEGFYGGFTVVIPQGKVMNVSQIFGDFIAQKNNYSYKFQVVKNGKVIYESAAKAASNITNCGSDKVATTINTTEIAALQNLAGTVEFRMPWWIASSAASGAILDFNITASFEDKALETFTVSYDAEGSGATGTAPAAVRVDEYASTVIPVNTTLYKEGYTLTAWNDGSADYAVGANYTPTADVTLTPVFTQNPVALDQLKKNLTVTWMFGKKNGAPVFDGSAQNYVKQVSLNGNATDLAIQMAGGKNDDRSDEWMNNQQKNMTVPVCPGAVVSAKVYYTNNAEFNGETLTYDAAVNGTTGNVVYTYTCPEGVGSTIDVNVGNQFLSYIEVTYPGSSDPWANFEDFALDMTNGAYITSTETSPITIGFKKSGQTFVRCAADDADAIGTVAGKFHSNEHGLQNFKLTVAVPGNVKISAGTCAWGGNLTVKKAGAVVASVNTNNGTCFHGNKTNNKVITYYEGEATTLTIEGGNYMPFISVESIEHVPSLYTLTFKNGDATVSTKDIYEGTGVGTLPTIDGLAADQYFLGWYSDASQIDTRVSSATVPTANTTYYAVVKTINTTNDMLVPEAGDAFSFIAHLEKANATATAANPAKIFLQNGTYDLGTLINTEVKDNVHILGESRDAVLVVNHPAQAGMSSSETLNVRGSNVYMQNFSVRCDVSYSGSTASGVGTAIRTYGDKNIFCNMNLQGNQDTFNTPMGDNAVAYVKGGRIEGTVDYICGAGNIWFEGVNLYMNTRDNADVIAAPSTAADTKYGYVFNGCTIDGDAAQAGKYNLARPWNNNPAATWINTTCIIKPSAKGYTTMGNHAVRFHEYNTMDAEGNVITGHSITGLNYKEAESDEIYLASIGDYTYAKVLGGWDPEATIALYSKTITLGKNGYSAVAIPFNCNVEGDAEVYYGEYNDATSSVALNEVTESIAENEGVILKGEEGAKVALYICPEAMAISGNALKAAGATLDAGTNYVLATRKADNVTLFVKYDGDAAALAGKAYLNVPGNSAKASIAILFGDDATAADVVETAVPAMTSSAFNVLGQKVNANTKGLVIINGKKYLNNK